MATDLESLYNLYKVDSSITPGVYNDAYSVLMGGGTIPGGVTAANLNTIYGGSTTAPTSAPINGTITTSGQVSPNVYNTLTGSYGTGPTPEPTYAGGYTGQGTTTTLDPRTGGGVWDPFNAGAQYGGNIFNATQYLNDNVEQTLTGVAQTPTNVLNVLNPLANTLYGYGGYAQNLASQGSTYSNPNVNLSTNFANPYVNLQQQYGAVPLNLSSQFSPTQLQLMQGYNPSSVNLQQQFGYSPLSLNTNYSPSLVQLGQNFAGAGQMQNALGGGIDYFGRLGISQGQQDIAAQRGAMDRQLATNLGRNAGNESLIAALQGQNLLKSGLAEQGLISGAQQGTLERVLQSIGLQNQQQQLMNQTGLEQAGFNQQSLMEALNAQNAARLQQAGYNTQAGFTAGQLSNEAQLAQSGFNQQSLFDALNSINAARLGQAGFNQESQFTATQLANEAQLAQAGYSQQQIFDIINAQNAAQMQQTGFNAQAQNLYGQLYNTALLQQAGFNQQAGLSEMQAQLASLQPYQNLLEALTALQGQQRGVTSTEANIGQRNYE